MSPTRKAAGGTRRVLDRFRTQVDPGHLAVQQVAETLERLAFTAPGVEHRRRVERGHEVADLAVEAADQPPDQRVAGLKLLVVARVDRCAQGR